MNGRNRHNKYRRTVYRRRNIGVIILISSVCLILSLTAFIVIGNLLKIRSESSDSTNAETNQTVQNSDSTNEKAPVKSIKAYSVLLETQGSGVFADRLDTLVQKGISEASIPLNTAEGVLLFKSTIANEISYPTGEAAVTLSKAIPTAKERNIYVSGIFYVNSFKIEDPLIRSVELSKDAAIVAEALNAGFDDVVLVVPHMTDAHADEAVRFIENIKAMSDGGAVGLCISENILSLEDTLKLSQTIDELDGKIDFLAVDLSLTNLSEGTEQLSLAISSKQHYLLMYKMRVLLPNSENDYTLSAIISEAESNGIKNIQIIP